MKRKQTTRSFVYLTIGLALLFFALPKVPHVTWSMEGAFTLSWLAFAMLFIGANLYQLIGVDRESQAKRQRTQWMMRSMRQVRGQYAEPKRPARQEKRRFMN